MVHNRVMHRKRLTSELHDSHFRLTIKDSISKIDWASNDYITQLSSTSQLNWIPVPVGFDAQGAGGVASNVPDSWRRDVVGKATPDRGGPREPWWSLGTREVADKMQQITLQSEPLGLRLSSPREQERHNVTVITLGSKYCSYVRSQLPLTRKPWTTLSNPCNKVRGIYFYKEVFYRLYHCVCLYYCVVMML